MAGEADKVRAIACVYVGAGHVAWGRRKQAQLVDTRADRRAAWDLKVGGGKLDEHAGIGETIQVDGG